MISNNGGGKNKISYLVSIITRKVEYILTFYCCGQYKEQ